MKLRFPVSRLRHRQHRAEIVQHFHSKQNIKQDALYYFHSSHIVTEFRTLQRLLVEAS